MAARLMRSIARRIVDRALSSIDRAWLTFNAAFIDGTMVMRCYDILDSQE